MSDWRPNEWYSVAYVQAVAGAAGIASDIEGRDIRKADLRFYTHEEGAKWQDPEFKAQVKSVVRRNLVKETKSHISYRIDESTYRRLSSPKNRISHHLLVVVVLPDSQTNWCAPKRRKGGTRLDFRDCAYWADLRTHTASASRSQTVSFHRVKQRWDTVNLREIVKQVGLYGPAWDGTLP